MARDVLGQTLLLGTPKVKATSEGIIAGGADMELDACESPIQIVHTNLINIAQRAIADIKPQSYALRQPAYTSTRRVMQGTRRPNRVDGRW